MTEDTIKRAYFLIEARDAAARHAASMRDNGAAEEAASFEASRSRYANDLAEIMAAECKAAIKRMP